MNAPIKRHASIVTLSRDHQLGLLIAMVMKKDSPGYKGMPSTPEDKIAFIQAQFTTHLNPHFIKEEEKLFPFISGRLAALDELISELKEEHKLFRKMISELPSREDRIEALDETGRLLETHIRKEERNLFQQVQLLFSEEELKELGSLLEE